MSAAPIVERTAQAAGPVTYEEMLSLVQADRRARLAMRRMLRDEGALKEPLVDRRQLVLERLETFIAKCMARRADVGMLLRGVAVAPIRDEEG